MVGLEPLLTIHCDSFIGHPEAKLKRVWAERLQQATATHGRFPSSIGPMASSGSGRAGRSPAHGFGLGLLLQLGEVAFIEAGKAGQGGCLDLRLSSPRQP